MKLYFAVAAALLLPAIVLAQHLRGSAGSDQRELISTAGIGGGASKPLWYNFGPYPSTTTVSNGVSDPPSCTDSDCPDDSVAYSFSCSTGTINSVTICSDNNVVRGVTAIGCSSGSLRISTDGARPVRVSGPLPTGTGCGTFAPTVFSDTAGGGFKGAQSATTPDNQVALLIFAGASRGRFSKVFGLDGRVTLLRSSTTVAPTDGTPTVKATVQIPSNYPALNGNEMGYCSTSTARIAGLAFTVTGTGAAARITGFGLRCT